MAFVNMLLNRKINNFRQTNKSKEKDFNSIWEKENQQQKQVLKNSQTFFELPMTSQKQVFTDKDKEDEKSKSSIKQLNFSKNSFTILNNKSFLENKSIGKFILNNGSISTKQIPNKMPEDSKDNYNTLQKYYQNKYEKNRFQSPLIKKKEAKSLYNQQNSTINYNNSNNQNNMEIYTPWEGVQMSQDEIQI